MRQWLPRPDSVVRDEAHYGPVRLKRQQIKTATVACVGGSDGSDSARIRRRSHLVEIPGAVVVQYVQMTGAIEERGVRIAVAVEIGPHTLLHSGESRKGMDGRKGALAIVAQDGGRSGG